MDEFTRDSEDRLTCNTRLYRFFLLVRYGLDDMLDTPRRDLAEISLLRLLIFTGNGSEFERRMNRALYSQLLGLPKWGEFQNNYIIFIYADST